MKSRITALLLALVMVTALLPFGASAARELPIYCVQRNDKVVSLTFDAAWGDDHTQNLLNILNRYQVKATFFLVSTWVDAYPNWVKALADSGMEVNNHSSTHPHLTQFSYAGVQAEVNGCSDKIQAITGVRPTLFRCPYGEYNDTVIRAIRDLGVTPIQWDVDSLDWSGNSADEIKSRVLSKVKPGSIILFHNDGAHTTEALPEIIETLFARGYSIVPISKNIYSGSYRIDESTGTQIPLAPGAPVLSMNGDAVSMTCSTPDAEIRYTLDGSVPTADSARYTVPFPVSRGTTVRACAVRPGMDNSPVTYITYSAGGTVMRDVTVSDWHYTALDRAVSMGVINGTAPAVMSPNTAVTRAMLVTMLYRLAGAEAAGAEMPFTDVDAGQYYFAPLCWAVQNGIVGGYEDNTFRPNNIITRAELSAMIARYLRSVGHTLPADLSVLASFTDRSTIPAWAMESMAAMAALKIVNGYEDSTIGPMRSATRAEAVTILLRAADLPAPEPDKPDPTEPPEESPAPTESPAPEETPSPEAPAESPLPAETPAPETPVETEAPTQTRPEA